jgi:hypothetical protein
MSDKINEGLKSIERIKLLMGYSLHETLSENIQHILTEQYNYQPRPSIPQRDNTYVKPPIQKNIPIQKNTPTQKNIAQPIKKITTTQTNGLSITGPYTKENLLYLGGIITVIFNGVGEGYYLLTNNTKNEIKINSVTFSGQEGKITTVFSKKPIKPNKTGKIYVIVNDKIISNKLNPTPPISQIDNLYVKPQIFKNQIEPVKKSINNEESPNILTIDTTIGKITVEVKYDYSESQKKQMQAIQNFNKGLSVPGGKKVPEGYSPFEYDEFLQKLNKLTQTCPNLKRTYNKLNEQSVIGAPNYGDTRSSFNPNDEEKKIFACNSEYKKLQSEYYNEKFPKGVTKDDLKDFNTDKTKINQEILNWQNSHKKFHKAKYVSDEFGVREKIQEEGYWFDEKLLTSSEKEEYQELLNKMEQTYANYGYDQRGSFDKFMDSGWGQLAQFGAIAVLAIAGFFTEGATWAVAADLLLNLGLGAYYVSRGNVREGLIWFCFAGMGQLHGLYNYLSSSIGRKLAGETLESVSKSIASKLVGVSLNNQVALNSFMYGVLTKNERIVFRGMLDTLKKNPEVVEKALENFAKEIAKGRNVYRDISFLNAMKLKPAAGKFIKNTFIDLAVTIPLVQNGYDKLKSIFKSKGVDITWGEKDNKILEYIAENKTESEIKNLFKVKTEIANSLDKKELEYYTNEQKKLTDQEIKDAIDKEIKMSSLQTEEYIKKIKEKIKNLDVEKEQREKNILSSPSEKERKMNMLNDKFKNNDITSDSLKTN